MLRLKFGRFLCLAFGFFLFLFALACFLESDLWIRLRFGFWNGRRDDRLGPYFGRRLGFRRWLGDGLRHWLGLGSGFRLRFGFRFGFRFDRRLGFRLRFGLGRRFFFGHRLFRLCRRRYAVHPEFHLYGLRRRWAGNKPHQHEGEQKGVDSYGVAQRPPLFALLGRERGMLRGGVALER